jgi:4-amino-4-deoxy-L-arabinose transferase-like glycosyltransferase
LSTPETKLAVLAAVLLCAALAVFGARFHWVEEAGTAERDGYVAQAGQILRGELPRDPYRPLLYPLLIAGVAKLGVAPFAAARLLSNLAAAALAWLAWAFGRRLGGPAAGAWAFALIAVNPNLWILGQHASTDMLFAALAAAALYAGLVHLERPSLGAAVAAGVFLGLAAFTRSNAVFLLPALVVAWWSGRGEEEGEEESRLRRAGGLGWGLAAAVLCLIPHWALRQAVFGSPFHDENWKNLAWKLYGFPDWSYLERVPFGSALEIVRADPLGVLRGGVSELGRFFFGGGIPQLFGTWVHVLLLVIGLAVALRRRPRAAGWLLFASALFLVAIAFAFFTWGRLLLLLLPVGCGLSFLPWRAPGRWGHALAFALVGVLAVKTFGFRLPAFVERHPVREVAVLRRLDASLPPGAALAGTSPFLGRYLGRPYVDLPDAFGREIAEPRLWYAKAAPLLRRGRVAYLVAGPLDLRDRPPSLLAGTPPVPWLTPAGREDGVTVWRVDLAALDRPRQGTPSCSHLDRADPSPPVSPLFASSPAWHRPCFIQG